MSPKKAKKKTSKKTRSRRRPSGPRVRVRMYNVGFGDCFLLTFPIKGGERHVLVDCGVHPSGPSPVWDGIADVADAVKEAVTGEDGPRIDLVVATHRHADHVSGFRSPAWQEVSVGEVWMPWTEDPKDARARRIRNRQSSLALEVSALAANRRGGEWARVQGLALNGLTNEAAMRTLHHGFAAPALRRFLPGATGARSMRPRVLGGVTVHVLGPSRDEAVIRDMDPPHEQSYLALAPAGGTAERVPFDPGWSMTPDQLHGEPQFGHLVLRPDTVKHLEELCAADPLLAAAALEKAVNGTSLVLVFELGQACLLFPGDAQWGTWHEILQRETWCELLERTTVLKVGHHGSHNATPADLVERHLAKGAFRALVSTREDTCDWDIPRGPLMEELAARSGQPVIRSDLRDPGGAPPEIVRDPENRWVDYLVPV